MAGIKRLISLHQLHPYWGVRRLALALSWSLNKTRRIKILAGVRTKLPKRTWCRPKKGKLAAPPPNLLPSGKEVLVEDFTHLGRFYLAVCMRLSTRQILSFKLCRPARAAGWSTRRRFKPWNCSRTAGSSTPIRAANTWPPAIAA